MITSEEFMQITTAVATASRVNLAGTYYVHLDSVMGILQTHCKETKVLLSDGLIKFQTIKMNNE